MEKRYEGASAAEEADDMGSFVHGNRWTAAREQKVASRLRRASPRPIAWCVIRTSGAAVHCTTRAIGAAWIASWLHDAAPRAAPAVLPGRVSIDYSFFLLVVAEAHFLAARGDDIGARASSLRGPDQGWPALPHLALFPTPPPRSALLQPLRFATQTTSAACRLPPVCRASSRRAPRPPRPPRPNR